VFQAGLITIRVEYSSGGNDGVLETWGRFRVGETRLEVLEPISENYVVRESSVEEGEGEYRFGFNGMQRDDDVAGKGNWQDYGLRQYDNRLGRFISIDPLASYYPWYASYQFAGNNPIRYIDLDGGEEKEPNASFSSHIPQLKTVYKDKIDRLPASERGLTKEAADAAFNRIGLFNMAGRWLSARLMTRWLEGQGGYDVLSHSVISRNTAIQHDVYKIDKTIKARVLAFARSQTSSGTFHFTTTVPSHHKQGGALLSDLGTAI
jgi:RHS repeat-associated protein